MGYCVGTGPVSREIRLSKNLIVKLFLTEPPAAARQELRMLFVKTKLIK